MLTAESAIDAGKWWRLPTPTLAAPGCFCLPAHPTPSPSFPLSLLSFPLPSFTLFWVKQKLKQQLTCAENFPMPDLLHSFIQSSKQQYWGFPGGAVVEGPPVTESKLALPAAQQANESER